MDLDRRKHDVDIIERVLGGMHDMDASEARTRVFDVDLPWLDESRHPTLEMTVGLDEPNDRRPKAKAPRPKKG